MRDEVGRGGAVSQKDISLGSNQASGVTCDLQEIIVEVRFSCVTSASCLLHWESSFTFRELKEALAEIQQVNYQI